MKEISKKVIDILIPDFVSTEFVSDMVTAFKKKLSNVAFLPRSLKDLKYQQLRTFTLRQHIRQYKECHSTCALSFVLYDDSCNKCVSKVSNFYCYGLFEKSLK